MLWSFLALLATANAAVIPRDSVVRVVIGNDDGWATANIRAFYNTLKSSGYLPMISAPAYNKSGTSSLDLPPIPVLEEGQFGTISVGAPAVGSDPNDSRIMYVNSFPTTGVRYGIQNAPSRIDGPPDIVVTGPNVGSNLGIITQFSGTIGGATYAASQGIPAIAFSGAGGTQHSFTNDDPVAQVYAQVAKKVVDKVIASGKPYLPKGIALNVNLPMADATKCTNVDDYQFILSRVNIDINPFTDDVLQCGTNHLPTESDVQKTGGCPVSISAYDGSDKFDVDKATQAVVRDKLKDMLSCLN